MKLKALKPRLHNIMFHTHTVTGIVISFVLFIIFYAGAFSLFRDDFYKWENPLARFEAKEEVDYDKTLKLVQNYINEKDAFTKVLLRLILIHLLSLMEPIRNLKKVKKMFSFI